MIITLKSYENENHTFLPELQHANRRSRTKGTENDGSKNAEYCKYCYQNGAFVNPDMTLEQMQSLVIEKMDGNNLPEDIMEAAIARLPHLKRWNKIHIL